MAIFVRKLFVAGFAILILMTMVRAASAAELIVISSGSAEPAMDFIADAFRKKTGHTVKITYNLGADGPRRLAAGEAIDVLVATSDTIKRGYAPQGLIEQGGLSIGRVGHAVMARPGVPHPDISTVDALRRSLLDADTVLITTETSGLYMESVFKKLGVFDQIQDKIFRAKTGPLLMDRVLAGTGREFGFLSPNAIRTYRDKGLLMVGGIPEELQDYREFMAVPTVNSTNKELAREFVRFTVNEGKQFLVENGFKQ